MSSDRERLFKFARFLEPIHGFAIGPAALRAIGGKIMFVRTALLAAAASLTLFATPVLAQTFNGFYNNDPAVTSGYAPYEAGGYQAYSGVPVFGPIFGVLTAPFTVASGGWAQPSPGCHVDRDFNGRYTSVCGM
jgi:hypothetical protein